MEKQICKLLSDDFRLHFYKFDLNFSNFLFERILFKLLNKFKFIYNETTMQLFVSMN